MNEEKLSELTVGNTYYLHALIKLLLRKQLITEPEIDESYELIKLEFENDEGRKIN